MRIIWLTDLHLDDAKDDEAQRLFNTILSTDAEAIVITGDIGDGKTFVEKIPQIQEFTGLPLYFVLGNHDCYDQSIEEAQKEAEDLDRAHPKIHYLSNSSPISLNEKWTLIGHDGWADGKCGNFLESPVKLADSLKIHNLMNISNEEQKKRLEELGAQAADSIRGVLLKAIKESDHILFLTHCPPFRLACRYKGVIADDDWAPHFVCQSIGDVISEVMPKYQDKELLVLCGHAHYPSEVQVFPNVNVLTGGGEVGFPKMEKVITL